VIKSFSIKQIASNLEAPLHSNYVFALILTFTLFFVGRFSLVMLIISRPNKQLTRNHCQAINWQLPESLDLLLSILMSARGNRQSFYELVLFSFFFRPNLRIWFRHMRTGISISPLLFPNYYAANKKSNMFLKT